MEKYLPEIIVAVTIGFFGVLWFGMRQLIQLGVDLLKQKLGSERFDRVTKQAIMVVRYLEQSPVWENVDNSEKFKLLKLALMKFIEANNIPLAEQDLDKIGEAAVRYVKKEIGEVNWGTNDAEMDDAISDVIDRATK